MASGRRRHLIPTNYSNLKEWQDLDINPFSELLQTKYRQRKSAVYMYAAGDDFHKIREATGISKKEVTRFVRRCIVADGEGSIFGFRALAYGFHLKSYERKAPVRFTLSNDSAGCSGALSQLFNKFPEIEGAVIELFCKGRLRGEVPEPRMNFIAIHQRFQGMLRKVGLQDSDWPFSTTSKGYKALTRFLNKYHLENPESAVEGRSGRDARSRSSVGTGFQPLFSPLSPFTCVQLDYHKVDAAADIILYNQFHGEVVVPVARWYYGLLIEERFKGVLGACIAFERNPTGDNALETIENALKPVIFILNDSNRTILHDGKVFINQIIPKLAYQCFSLLKVDNAWCNSATEVINNIITTIGCAIDFGPVRSWWPRSQIERTFGELTRKGLQRMPSTYGSGPTDTKSDNPPEQAKRFRILLSDLVDVIFGTIASYNRSPNEGRQFSSPVSAFTACLDHPESGFFPQYLPLNTQNDMRLLFHIEEVTVRGSIKKNVRPFFISGRCRHTNPRLANTFSLIGKTLIVYILRTNCLEVYATVKETGEDLGKMVLEARWSTPISLRDRNFINRYGLSLRYEERGHDPVQNWKKKKKAEIVNWQRNKTLEKNRKKAGTHAATKTTATAADALLLAKMEGSVFDIPKQTSLPVSGDAQSAETYEVEESREDPFGFLALPVLQSVRRR
jgi:putative transposase